MADISSILAQIFSGQQQQLQASNPYLIASSIMPQIAQRKGKGATSSIIANALLGLTKGALAGYGTADANSQFNDYMSNALPVIENPNAPADSKYSQLQSMLKLNDSLSEAESRRELNRSLGLNYGARVGEDGTATPIQGLGEAAGQFENDKFTATYGSPVASPAQPEAESPGGSVISFPGVTSLDAREKEIYKENLRNRMTPTQAAQSARAAIKGERDAMADSFDTAKAAREKGMNLLTLADQADAAVQSAGYTGPMGALRQTGAQLASYLSEDQAQKAAATSLLDSLAPEFVKMARSPGAVSDYETKLYIGAGANKSLTPEANKILIDKMRTLGKIELEHADFLDTYRRQAGTTDGADQLWSAYKQASPIFVSSPNGGVEVNPQRVPWKQFFSGGQAQQQQAPTPMQQAPMSAGVQQNQAQSPAPQAAAAPKYSAQQLQQAGYSAADIAALQQQGMVQ